MVTLQPLFLQNIGCTSAIKASFIALGLHYLCLEIIKEYGYQSTQQICLARGNHP